MNKPLVVPTLILVLVLAQRLAFAAELQLTPAQLDNANLTSATVSTRESLTQLKLNAILTADRRKTYRVAPVVDGMVTTLQVVAHEEVRKGQVLAELRSHSLGQAQAEYLEALARFDLAKAERTRIEGLWKDGIVAESRWLKVDSEYKSARATLQARRRLLSLTGLSDKQIERLAKQPNRLAVFDLTSPIDGLVTGVEIESGQLLSAGQAAFHVDDLSTLWAMVKIPVARLPQVKIGVEAKILVQASPGRFPPQPCSGSAIRTMCSRCWETAGLSRWRLILASRRVDGCLLSAALRPMRPSSAVAWPNSSPIGSTRGANRS
jgi:cobalt-zinc-cadmium efflux system membrane fusion protein